MRTSALRLVMLLALIGATPSIVHASDDLRRSSRSRPVRFEVIRIPGHVQRPRVVYIIPRSALVNQILSRRELPPPRF